MKRRNFFKVVQILVTITCILSGCSKEGSTNIVIPSEEITAVDLVPEENPGETATDVVPEENPDETATDVMPEENPDETATDVMPEENPSETATDVIPEESPDETVTDPQVALVIDTHEPLPVDVEADFGFYYDQLTQEQKVIYLSIFSYYENIKKEYVGFKGANKQDVRRSIKAINYDQVFFGVETFNYYQEDNSIFIKIKSLLRNLSSKQRKKVEKKAKNILKSIAEPIETEEGMVRKIYDWCTNQIKYDETKKHIGDVYGALVNKACICEGYAEVFKYLCSKVGIKCIKVTNSKHAWNYVKIAGRWYSVDVTWGQANTKRYLLEGKESFFKNKDHIPEPEGFNLPKLAKKAYYPTDDEIQEIVDNLQKNIEGMEKQLEVNEDEALGQLLYSATEKAREILGKIDQSVFGCYINTSEFQEDYKKLATMIKVLNEEVDR